MDSPTEVKIGLAVATALSLWGAGAYFGFETEYQKQNPDPYQIAAQTARLAGARAAIPENAVVGYLTDLEPNTVATWSLFSATQYILAPRILKHDAAQDRVLGNFARPADFAARGRQHGLIVDRDFGNGVVLFRKEAAR